MNRLFLLVISVACALGAAAVEIKDVFSAMPDSVLPTLTRNNRLDMVDFIDSGMKAEVNDVTSEKAPLTSPGIFSNKALFAKALSILVRPV